GKLVALLDQVEDRYARVERPEPALDGLAQRVRNLRDQVIGPELAIRRREALRTVKRAVDRFTDRDDVSQLEEQDALASAIAEIRGWQMSGAAAALGHRVLDAPEFRELNRMVGGLSGRLEKLEGELKSQRTSNGSVHEVASQIEQLTHVVELLAGAVGETGQVKRLESQIGALASLIEKGPKAGLSAINKRLDDVSATVGKLAELQAQQMEREIVREDRLAAAPAPGAAALAPAMHAIETSVRNVCDRIDSIEKNVTLSSGDFERLTAEMAAFTQAMKDRETAPGALISKVDALAARIRDFQAANGDVASLQRDVSALRDAVMDGMEPRFNRIESQIEALSDRMAPAAGSAEVEDQLKLLVQRINETGAQLNGLAKLYSASQDKADIETVATLVAERVSDAITRKASVPVAMFGPDSLKSIEGRLSGLIKSAGKTHDYEALADLVAERTSLAVAKSAPGPAAAGISQDSMSAFEQRMTALFNAAGQDTAERLMRLEAVLSNRAAITSPAAMLSGSEPPTSQSAAAPAARSVPPAPLADSSVKSRGERLEAMLAALGGSQDDTGDIMPANPADDAPLVDPGFGNPGPVRAALAAKVGAAQPPAVMPERATIPDTTAPKAAAAAIKSAAEASAERPSFDPGSAERPPRPQSSFAQPAAEPFAAPNPVVSQAEAQISQNSTSTFVAAARRAQRARAEAATPNAAGCSAISRALSRFMSDKSTDPAADRPAAVIATEKPIKQKKPGNAAKAGAVVAPPMPGEPDDAQVQPSFLVRHCRPLLLAATLVAVSMLALNLVIQRMAPAQPQQPAVETIEPDVASAGKLSASQYISLVRPEPRVIDMIDGAATASINPNVFGFSRATMPTAQMPSTLLANATGNGETFAPSDAPTITNSILDKVVATEPFDLPVEGIGPLKMREAAANGNAKAQLEVAVILSEGRAVEQNYDEAAIWYERSAAQGFVPAQYRLGNLYETGTGVDKDLEIAKLWYQRAAEADNRMAMHNLAALYAGGQLGDRAFETAAEWFAQVAARGMTDSQFSLDMLYARGLGVPQDFE
ncbi:MAG: hypothetical protein MO852_10020, partial [Candidatus Devosia euplotis]|nr:hypothetical protein [Candidatus Devosia euplotis]